MSREEREIVDLSFEDIDFDAGTQPRRELDQPTLSRYRAMVRNEQKMPEPVVYVVGINKVMADGFHRAEAFRLEGYGRIDCELRHGELRDAILYAITANKDHGLALDEDDRERAVKWMLSDPICSKWSDRRIADETGIDRERVGKMRAATGGNRQSRIGKDGREINTAAIADANAARPKPSTKRESEKQIIDTETGEVLDHAAVISTTRTETRPAQTDSGLLLSLQQIIDCIEGLAAFEPSRDALPLVSQALRGLTELARKIERL